MKVRICSGNQKGAVVDMPQTEAESAISTGFAELYDPEKDQAALDAKNASETNAEKAAKKVSKQEAARLVKQSPSAKPAEKATTSKK
jgi:hypothetical protein